MNFKLLDAVHPVIRIIAFLILSLSIALGSTSQLLFAFVLVLVVAIGYGSQVMAAVWPMLWRLRWFLLSILFIYWWLTPGQALWSTAPSWLPSREGLMLGLHRIAVLAVIVFAVGLLLQATRRDQLVSALYWLASPLSIMDVSPERLAVRIVMTLEYVTAMRALVAESVKAAPVQSSRLQHYGAIAATIFGETVRRGDCSECMTIELTLAAKPPLIQWLLPVCLVVVFYSVGLIN